MCQLPQSLCDSCLGLIHLLCQKAIECGPFYAPWHLKHWDHTLIFVPFGHATMMLIASIPPAFHGTTGAMGTLPERGTEDDALSTV